MALSYIISEVKRDIAENLDFLAAARDSESGFMRRACASVRVCLSVCLFVCLSVCRQIAKTRFSQN